MNIAALNIPEIKLIEPQVFGDERGYFMESWNAKRYAEVGIDCHWVQDNESRSRFGVLRGLHFQLPPYTQAKLVRVIEGAVLDITVDIRRNSPTFGQYPAVTLSGSNHRQLFIPRGFAHGFVVLTPSVLFAYKCDNLYMPSHERGIAFDDPQLNINWQLPARDLILSEKDQHNPSLQEAELFDYNVQDYML